MQARGPRLTVISLVAGAVALVLGFAGYRALSDDLGVAASLYRSVQLFFLDYQGPATEVPWQLETARFLAAAVVLVTALGVIFTLAREQAERLRIRVWAKPHVVVAGLGSRGTRIAEQLRAEGSRVVAVERSPGPTPAARAAGIAVLRGDARSAALLETAQLAAARDMVVVAGDDSVALEILASAHRVLARRSRARTDVHVAIDDLVLWQQLHRLALARERFSTHVEFVSLPDRIAEVLVSGAQAAFPSAAGRDDILVHGAGPTAVRTVIHALRRSLLAGNFPAVALGGPAAESVRAELMRTAPWAHESGYIRLENSGTPGARRDAVSAALVCGLSDAEALAVGTGLAGELETAGPRVFVAVPDQDSSDALAATEMRFDALQFVPTQTEALGPRLLEGGAKEMIAKAKHEDYVLQEQMRGGSPAQNPSIVPWQDLPESLRESNRRFAESVGGKLGELGASLVPLAGPVPEAALPLTGAQLEALAEREHERWMRDLEADGWRLADGPKDPERRLHPLLIPWSELPEAERQKDRDAILALPKALATVGYSLELPAAPEDR